MHKSRGAHADGGAGRPTYKRAAQWFRKAADRGVRRTASYKPRSSLAPRTAWRDIAESYKAFPLAAARVRGLLPASRTDVAKVSIRSSSPTAKLRSRTLAPRRSPTTPSNVVPPPAAGRWSQAARSKHEPVRDEESASAAH